MFFGAIVTGKLADLYGRRITIIYACFSQFLFSFLFAYINSLSWLIILRFLYGFIYGFTLPITISAIAEISTKDVRGKLIICVNFCVTMGKLYALLLIFLCNTKINTYN